ncbi:MAG: hypothetical protein CVU50_06280 [Candidatus Cloacimonetes bacterium HGW-Cloacimonetes-3]|jgi:tetratricopeptide (TPR) repeat protein|nr:MAG: hypothetical protein CVU50_06280 [Candidatus Cloacimonetes bacterium HGW-Cloacimonetes-3]
MKLKHKKIALFILILILLSFIFELTMRPKVLSQSWADMQYRGKRFSSAEKVFARNAKKDDATASANLAKSMYKQDRIEDAERQSDKALALSPHKSNLNYDRANIAYKQGDYTKALELYRKAMLEKPKDTDIKANYELTLKKMQSQAPKPQPEKEKEQDPDKQEEIRNILGGLDNKESSDRKQQNPQQGLPPTKWW